MSPPGRRNVTTLRLAGQCQERQLAGSGTKSESPRLTRWRPTPAAGPGCGRDNRHDWGERCSADSEGAVGCQAAKSSEEIGLLGAPQEISGRWKPGAIAWCSTPAKVPEHVREDSQPALPRRDEGQAGATCLNWQRPGYGYYGTHTPPLWGHDEDDRRGCAPASRVVLRTTLGKPPPALIR